MVEIFINFISRLLYDAVKAIFRTKKQEPEKIKNSSSLKEQPSKIQLDVKNIEPTRLSVLLRLINQAKHPSEAITYSEIAEAAKIESTKLVEKYFRGEKDVPNSFLDFFCRIYNVNPRWLKHGKEKPFSHFQKIFQEAYNASEFISSFEPHTIYFVKSKSEYANFCVVLEKTNDFAILHKFPNWMISDKTGGGGQMQTTSLYLLILALNRRRYVKISLDEKKEIPFNLTANIFGVELESDENLAELIYGDIHPNFLYAHVRKYGTSYWWDDFTDHTYKTFTKQIYAERYGVQFVKAQEIVKYMIDTRTSYAAFI